LNIERVTGTVLKDLYGGGGSYGAEPLCGRKRRRGEGEGEQMCAGDGLDTFIKAPLVEEDGDKGGSDLVAYVDIGLYATYIHSKEVLELGGVRRSRGRRDYEYG
jgi:hypothetical protein